MNKLLLFCLALYLLGMLLGVVRWLFPKSLKFIARKIVDFYSFLKGIGNKSKSDTVNVPDHTYDQVIEDWIGRTNKRGKTSNYEFFEYGPILSYDHPENRFDHICLHFKNGVNVYGTVDFEYDDNFRFSKVRSFESDDGKFVVYGEQPQFLDYKLIRNDVKDIVDNDLRRYLDTQISEAYSQDEEIILDLAEGLNIPQEEFNEKYDTSKYRKAWDSVLKETLEKSGCAIENFDLGMYYMKAV